MRIRLRHLWLGIVLVACAKRSASTESLSTSECTPPETVNGYLDGDGCADDLARLMVRVVDIDGTPAPGLEVFIPGLEKPFITSTEGMALLFELMPGAVITVTARDPTEDQEVSGTMELREGANELLMTASWRLSHETTPLPSP